MFNICLIFFRRNTQIQPIRMRESVKIGATCPAYINVHYNEDGLVIIFKIELKLRKVFIYLFI